MSALRQILSKVDDYPALLDACWQEHLAPRADDAPTVISTFAGAGGSSLGYSMAGFRELLVVEWDDNAVATFKLNFPDVPVYHGDIAELTIDEMLTLTGLQPGQLDVFDGSPPCQGFSTAGKRRIDDPRNQLFREYVRLLRGLQPKIFVMENVSGMVKGKMKLIFANMLRLLKASGYQVSARLLNAMYFGVPQSRERMIFVGVRNDLGKAPSHPQAWSIPVTVKQALCSVGDSEIETPILSPLQIQRYGEIKRGSAHSTRFSFVRTAWNAPSNTIVKERGSGGLFHPDIPRLLHHAELKRIGAWPDHVRFIGDFDTALNRIGNSVPPLFMRSIALHVRREILDSPPAPINE